MAFTITDEGNGANSTSSATVVTGSTVDAAIGDWLVAIVGGDNNGSGGASSLSSVTDNDGNTWTQRALINFDPGAAAAGATLGIFTSAITVAKSGGTVTANFSPNTVSKAIQVYRVEPGAGESISFVAADTTGSTGTGMTHSAATVSVTSGDLIFGAGALEYRDAVTGDSDTTNGSWSAIITRTGDSGSNSSSMKSSSQYKVVDATGNQSWAATTVANVDSARSYVILHLTAAAGSARSFGFIIG